MDQEYSKREIDTFMKEIQDTLNLILGQTSKTNGRVGSLENWRWFITGGLAIISVLIIPYLTWQFVRITDQLDNLTSTLSAYDVKVEE